MKTIFEFIFWIVFGVLFVALPGIIYNEFEWKAWRLRRIKGGRKARDLQS